MNLPAKPSASNASDNNKNPSTSRSPFLNAPDDNNKRRSSSRSIKPRRFDDELVEYNLGVPGTSQGKRAKRMGSQSHTSQVADLPSTKAPVTPAHPPQEREMSGGRSLFRPHKACRQAQLSRLSDKDMKRWKPTDDLALIIGVEQTNDLSTVLLGTKFSRDFTLSELYTRWRALLYNAEISQVARAAVGKLHPDLVAAVQKQALYSDAEEKLLGSLLSTSHPTEDKFQELLEQNPHIFYFSRTPKILMAHWQKMKQYKLLPDQSVEPLPKNHKDRVLLLSDSEDTDSEYVKDTDSELPDYKEEGMDVDMQIADRIVKKEVRVLVQSITSGNTEFDNNTLAVLHGKLVRYLMCSREITIGCGAKNNAIDVDLSLEGPVKKASRKQATIQLRNNGDFFISSKGKRPIFIDGKPVFQGTNIKLNHNAVIEIVGLRFIFLENTDLISAIRQEALKVNIPD